MHGHCFGPPPDSEDAGGSNYNLTSIRIGLVYKVSTWVGLPSNDKKMPSHYQQPFVLFLLVLLSGRTVALSSSNNSSPIVTLPYGSFQGKVVGDLIQHLGIPFAAPPYVNTTRPILITYLWCSTGELRFGLPQDPLPFDGIRQSTAFGAACPQQNVTVNATLFSDVEFPTVSHVSEDCAVLFTLNLPIQLTRPTGLFINVVRPVNVSSHRLLPVVFVSIQISK